VPKEGAGERVGDEGGATLFPKVVKEVVEEDKEGE
jgi:hypothetical protein